MSDNEQNNGLATILAFSIGFMAGSVIGLLYAPASGKNTREKLRETSTDVKNQTVAFAQQTIGTIKEGAQTFRPRQSDATDSEDGTTEET